jgi:hypothetical protein
MAESLMLVLDLKKRIGIIFNKLTSRPSQAVSHEEEETAIIVPVIVSIENKKK